MAAEEGHEEHTSSQTAKTPSSASSLFVGMSTRTPSLDSDLELDEELDSMSQGIALMESTFPLTIVFFIAADTKANSTFLLIILRLFPRHRDCKCKGRDRGPRGDRTGLGNVERGRLLPDRTPRRLWSTSGSHSVSGEIAWQQESSGRSTRYL